MKYASAMAALRWYSLRRRLLGWKLVPSLGVALVPTLIAVVYSTVFDPARDMQSPWEFNRQVLAPMCLYFVAPFVSMLTLLPVLGELYERGSVGYLVTRPVPRWVILAGLYQGGVLAVLPLMVLAGLGPSLALMPVSRGVELKFWMQDFVALVGVLWIAGLVYGSLCLYFGVWSKRAILWSLGVLFGLGTLAGSIPGNLKNFSLHRYLFGLLREWMDLGSDPNKVAYWLDPSPPATFTSLGVLLAATAVFLFLANWAVRRRDIL